ncbi:bacillithiol biosynthesis deacetylase BshB1 [Pontibacter sp. G13]|uniref:bacillithiol biosynthesis deacetylase BshB1 n=1 Tax=Pontibacter sp. G13 TaxID=3074898 RepID=UPI00288A627A|nr:bacillithiol biosynthesis deacetylase BshB1 [Pontibacter sp. G13]WNJ19874.1 bacillithiol biosynthesis deacetylase BshB1 [Pontibacter sp. G13]
MKLDVLIFAAHPDDAELGCGGTILKWTAAGKKVGIVDLTRGELGSRGTADLRDQEAADSAQILGLSIRENLRFRDGFFVHDESHELAVIQAIRHYRPEIVLANAPSDRHPDHGRGSKLVRDAAFKSGLRMISTSRDGQVQEHWRPKRLFHYIQDHYLEPSFVVDVTPHWERKMEAIRAFKSQFFDPNATGPQTYISSQDFWHFLEARARTMGHRVGATFGEGFISETPLQIHDPLDLI